MRDGVAQLAAGGRARNRRSAEEDDSGRRRSLDHHRFAVERRPGQADRVGIHRGVRRLVGIGRVCAFYGQRVSIGLGDDDARLIVVGDVGGDTDSFDAVVELGGHGPSDHTLDAVGDDPAVAEQVVADDAIRRGWALDADEIRSEAASDDRRVARPCTKDEEAVVTLGAIDFELLDVHEVDVEPCAVNALGCDHEVVTELGADHNHDVEAIASIDVHRRVHRVLDQVGSSVAAHIGQPARVLLRTGEGERLDQEGVVAVAAVERHRGQVVEDDEVVVARTAVDRHRLRRAVAQPAARRLDRRENVLRSDVGQQRRAA